MELSVNLGFMHSAIIGEIADCMKPRVLCIYIYIYIYIYL